MIKRIMSRSSQSVRLRRELEAKDEEVQRLQVLNIA